MAKKPEKIIIVGAGASGKNYLSERYISKGYSFGVSYTTRPKREGEVEGKDYFFIDKESFREKVRKGKILEYDIKNDWMYGTPIKEFETKDLFIMTPRGLSSLTKQERSNCFVIYLDIPVEVRRERLEKRTDGDVDRRIRGDGFDFEGFKDYDLRIQFFE
jgi:guanylate kinase